MSFTHFRKVFSAFLITLFALSFTYAQQSGGGITIPLNIRKAYEAGTRSYDGRPGEKYWQNSSDYDISVRIDPLTRQLTGKEKITYYNESPDTLSTLTLRLYQDINRAVAQRDFQMSRGSISEGVTIDRLLVNGKDIKPNGAMVTRSSTNLNIALSEKLTPSEELKIEVDWHFQLPQGSGIRMGTYGDSTYFVGYWYPQVAVYDDIDKWDNIEYSGTVEFYNDFSNFNVEITVPEGFAVWATGVLQNPDEILNPDYLKRYNKAMKSDSIIKIVTAEDLKKGGIYKNRGEQVWKFKASYVPDFAFATSPKYLWDAVSAVSDSAKDKRVLVSAAYDPSSKDFYSVASIAKKTIEMLSHNLPGVAFPYPRLTVFNGEGGMEYPMMVNDGSNTELWETVHVTSHEIAHTYFPFYMGTNERKYAWMDEGWATMLPFEIQSTLAPGYDPSQRNAQGYEQSAGKEQEVPPIIPSNQLRGNTYRIAAYRRPAEAYKFLRDMLGTELFDKALREFIGRWNGKHPLPYDFFFTFNQVAGEDLSWYWNPWFFEKGYPDLSIKQIENSEGKTRIIIERLGNIPVPVSLTLTLQNGKKINIYKNASVWKDGKREIVIEAETLYAIRSAELDNKTIPDADRRNNKFPRRGTDF